MNIRDDFIKSQLFWRLGGGVLIVLGIAFAVIITPLIFHLPVVIGAVALWGYISTYHPDFTGKLIAFYIVLSLVYIVYAVITIIHGDWIIGAIRCILGAAELTTAYILAKQWGCRNRCCGSPFSYTLTAFICSNFLRPGSDT